MEIIKNNQLLKIDLTYDNDGGIIAFEDFLRESGIEHMDGNQYIKIGNPDARHYRGSQLNEEAAVWEELEVLRHNISNETMPALTILEAWDLSEQVNAEDWEAVDWETARDGLMSVTHQSWYASLDDDCKEAELRPYRYTTRGYCQGDYSYLYLIGMCDSDAKKLVADFELYAYDTPYQFRVELIDCQSGDTIDEYSLGIIYDDADLAHLKEELESAIKNLDGIDEEVMRLAFDAIRPLNYTDIKL